MFKEVLEVKDLWIENDVKFYLVRVVVLMKEFEFI